MAKIRSTREAVNASLQQFAVFAEDLSVGEQIVPYLLRHLCKIFICGKPIRFGYKHLVPPSSCNYPFRFKTSVEASKMRLDQPSSPYIVSNLL